MSLITPVREAIHCQLRTYAGVQVRNVARDSNSARAHKFNGLNGIFAL